MTEADFLRAAFPLLASGEVEVLEWSFDTGWGANAPAPALREVIAAFSAKGRLIGHGVSFSLLSGEWTERHQTWVDALREEVEDLSYRHISEHFGFLTAGNMHQGSPFPVPLTPSILELGQTRMCLLAETAKVPVGLENLSFAFTASDVARQGEFLDLLLEPVNGFLVLDLHNLYCQAVNFECELESLMLRYPLERVREMHISGGSWSETPSSTRPVRRDTHDEAVPEAIFEFLPTALEHCPGCEAVIFERIGNTLQHPTDVLQFQQDFRRLKHILESLYANQPSYARTVPSHTVGSSC